MTRKGHPRIDGEQAAPAQTAKSMTATIRIAVRKFDPFERAITRQFADFQRVSGVDARLEIEARVHTEIGRAHV